MTTRSTTPSRRRSAAPHDAADWADCTGTVYDVDIRHENAVHSLEHGAVWITYDPDALSDDEIATLAELVEGESGRMLSPYAGLDSPISLQAWSHQLKVDSVDDKRIEQFADFLTRNGDIHPEAGRQLREPRLRRRPAGGRRRQRPDRPERRADDDDAGPSQPADRRPRAVTDDRTRSRRAAAASPRPRAGRCGRCCSPSSASALVLLGGGLAVALGIGRTDDPAADSVDAGFARDMATHHLQGVEMANLVPDRSKDPEVRQLAFDIADDPDQPGRPHAGLAGALGRAADRRGADGLDGAARRARPRHGGGRAA